MQKKYIIISAFIFTVMAMTLLFIMAAYAFKGRLTRSTNSIDNIPTDMGGTDIGQIITLEGVVTKFNPQCAVDAACSVEIDNKYLITVAAGMMPADMAPQYGMNDVGGDDVGARVRAKGEIINMGDISTNGLTEISIDEKNSSETFYLLKLQNHFACSDNCPGDPSKYKKIIFETVKKPEDCVKIGGTPYEYTGWGTTQICLAD